MCFLLILISLGFPLCDLNIYFDRQKRTQNLNTIFQYRKLKYSFNVYYWLAQLVRAHQMPFDGDVSVILNLFVLDFSTKILLMKMDFLHNASLDPPRAAHYAFFRELVPAIKHSRRKPSNAKNHRSIRNSWLIHNIVGFVAMCGTFYYFAVPLYVVCCAIFYLS